MYYKWTEKYTFPMVISKVYCEPYSRVLNDIKCWWVDVELRGPDNVGYFYVMPFFTKEAALSQVVGVEIWD